MRKLLWVGGLILVLGLLYRQLRPQYEYPAPLPKRALTPAEKAVASAQRVQVFRLDFDPSADILSEELDKYKKSRSITWTSSPALENAKALVIRAAGEHGPNLACAPRPGVGLRFWNGNTHQDVIFCFECMQWAWGENSHHWQTIGPSAAQLLEVAVEAFPDDALLKSRRAEARRLSSMNMSL